MKIISIKTTALIAMVIILISSISSAFAAPRNPMARIHPGMTYSQVKYTLGNPRAKVYLNNRHEQWFYSKRSYNGVPYHTKVIEFHRGRVVAFFDKKNIPNRRYRKHYRLPRNAYSVQHYYPAPRQPAVRFNFGYLMPI